MERLPAPTASSPILFGVPAPEGDLLSWDWAERRLVTAEHYWIATTRPGGRPHARPVWGVWLDDGLWFSTGSLAARNLRFNEQITVHLGDGREVVIIEGSARPEADSSSLHAMCDVYSRKYDHPMSPAEDGTIRDGAGNGGPAYRVTPHIVFGWGQDMTSPTRWTFPPSMDRHEPET